MLKREVVKYIRDKAKAAYPNKIMCEICQTSEKLELHHYKSISELSAIYIEDNNVDAAEVLTWREDFIIKHNKELYEEVATLCKTHHAQLHDVYGQHPELYTAKLQKKWIATRRDKYNAKMAI